MMTRRTFTGKVAAALPFGLLPTRLIGMIDEPATPEAERYRTAERQLLQACHVQGRSSLVQLARPPLSVRILETGKGEPLVLIHGGGATLAQLAPLMGSLEADFSIYAPDRPGCGLTQKLDYTGVALRQQAVDFMTPRLNGLLEEPLPGHPCHRQVWRARDGNIAY